MLALKGEEEEEEGSLCEGRENFADIKMDQVYAVLNVFLQIFKVNIACRKGKWSVGGCISRPIGNFKMHSGGFLVKVSAKQMEQETAVPSYLLHIKSIDDDDGDKDTKMWMSRGGDARGRLPRTMHRVKYMQSFPIGHRDTPENSRNCIWLPK